MASARPPLTGDDGSVMKREVIETKGHDPKRPQGISVKDFFEIAETVKFLKSHKASRVALQFSDVLLPDSHSVYQLLREGMPEVAFFILADTSYGSCCVDEVASSHVDADAIVHYGDACLTKTGAVPVKYVFGRAELDLGKTLEGIRSILTPTGKDGKEEIELKRPSNLFVFLQTRYQHAQQSLQERLSSSKGGFTDIATRVHIAEIDTSREAPAEGDAVLFIGPEECAFLTMIRLSLNTFPIYRIDVDTHYQAVLQSTAGRLLARRFYLMSKIKEAEIIGIVVGTMSVGSYLHIIRHLQRVIRDANKKSYLILVGKINVPKLANYAEIDIFVFVACPFQSIVDSSDYFAGIVTPFEVEIALVRGREWTGEYSPDFQEVLP
eukprot:jgi/Bigna1/37759/e_gw1.21.164.1